MNNLSFGGGGAGREAFAYYETIAGGMGASAKGEGWSATHTHMTNSWNTPVEAFEHQYPVRIESYRVRKRSGGQGKHRGGDGIVREFRFLAPAEVTILSDRRVRGAYSAGGRGSSEALDATRCCAGRKAAGAAQQARFEMCAGRCAAD